MREQTIRLDKNVYKYIINGRKLTLENDNPHTLLTYTSTHDITSVTPVFNAPFCICVSTITDTSYILKLQQSSTFVLQGVIPCVPLMVYHSAGVFYYNKESSVVRVDNGAETTQAEWQVFGFDVRTNSLMVQNSSQHKVYRVSAKADYAEIVHPCLKSTQKILPKWATIINENCVVIVSTRDKVMFVRERLITSYYVCDHEVKYLNYHSEGSLCSDFALISCHGNSSLMTLLTLPVLGVYKHVDCVESNDVVAAIQNSETNSDNPVVTQLLVSCEAQIAAELDALTRLYDQYAEKLQFLSSVWSELCQGDCDDTRNRAKVPKHHGIMFDHSGFPVSLPYQLPVLPPFRSQISLFQDADQSFTLYCMPNQKLRNVRNFSGLQLKQKNYQFEEVTKHFTVRMTKEWKEKLLRIFRAALAEETGDNNIRTNNLAYLSFLATKLDRHPY